MSKRDDSLLLEDILEAVSKINTKGKKTIFIG